jgi:hypothetical protein
LNSFALSKNSCPAKNPRGTSGAAGIFVNHSMIQSRRAALAQSVAAGFAGDKREAFARRSAQSKA